MDQRLRATRAVRRLFACGLAMALGALLGLAGASGAAGDANEESVLACLSRSPRAT